MYKSLSRCWRPESNDAWFASASGDCVRFHRLPPPILPLAFSEAGVSGCSPTASLLPKPYNLPKSPHSPLVPQLLSLPADWLSSAKRRWTNWYALDPLYLSGVLVLANRLLMGPGKRLVAFRFICHFPGYAYRLCIVWV